ncbi:MAG: glycoside hydrolase family 2 protein [Lachnospiraceae bacterium]|nr:glycoside hydrolase family 2 protein [Lachnospiraceae bacterium]
MQKRYKFNKDWSFELENGNSQHIDLPHTWNNIDGQDGGDDYRRTEAKYTKVFDCPQMGEDEEIYLEFDGVNSECNVFLNHLLVFAHTGGYSTFRVNISQVVREKNNELEVVVSNQRNDRVYPQKADFTFYGGIYRDVNLLVVNKKRFDLDYFGGVGIKIEATPKDDYTNATVHMETFRNVEEGNLQIEFLDMDGNVLAAELKKNEKRWNHSKNYEGEAHDAFFEEFEFQLRNIHLWEGVKNPYLYKCVVTLTENGNALDQKEIRFGIRDFSYDAKKGFFLNGKSYPLRGVSRHQDRKGVGNAITEEMHREDMDLICEVGANTIRLAHYQHSQFFYDLCDEKGMVVWAEIPYISEHMENGRQNTILQMKELIVQNFNHPSIVCWGVSNEITISTKNKKDMLDNHHVLNDLCHKMDKTRFTTLACYAMCSPFHPVAHITDTVSWNLYLGWYVPGLFLNDLWMRVFHFFYPNRSLGYSEYGCEGMPNLHSNRPRRGDHSEEYQAKYHEYMLRCFERNPYLWATHVWNMFDFAADARNQGGEPGMNHKGLVTFDRKTKKDSFYLYKAWWSDDPFVHIASKRFIQRTQKKIQIKVYSNLKKVSLYQDGKLLETKEGSHVFEFTATLQDGKTNEFAAVSGNEEDKALFKYTTHPTEIYALKDVGDKGANWT